LLGTQHISRVRKKSSSPYGLPRLFSCARHSLMAGILKPSAWTLVLFSALYGLPRRHIVFLWKIQILGLIVRSFIFSMS